MTITCKSKTRRNSGKSLVAIEQLEAEMEELVKKSQDITETMHSTNDAADLIQLQSELDQLTVQQEAVMEEWAELSEQVE